MSTIVNQSEAPGLNLKPSNFAKRVQTAAKRESLSKDFFGEVIKLETDFRSNSYTLNTINQLIQLYVKAVGHYDSLHDEISSYFTFKIQDVLATKKSLTLLAEEKHKAKTNNRKMPALNITPATPISDPKYHSRTKKPGFGEGVIVSGFDIGENSDEDTADDVCKNKWNKRHPTREQNKSLADLKSEKQRYVELFHRFEAQKESLEKNLSSTLDVFKKASQDNDAKVLDNISSQKQRLLKKIEQRKSATILSLTMNNSAYYVASRDSLEQSYNKGESCLDAMLNELDDSYEGQKQRVPSLGENFLTPSKIFMKNEQRSRIKSLFSRKGTVNFEENKALSARDALKKGKEGQEKLNNSAGGAASLNNLSQNSEINVNVEVEVDLLCDDITKLEP